jgi:hypothetical protein
METRTDKFRSNLLLGTLFILMAGMSWKLIDNMRLHQQLVQDRAELRDVRYGMLNADKWVQQISAILEKKVKELELKGEERESMKRALERILDTLITEADRHIREQHTSGNWWDRTTGRIKEGMRNTLMDVDTIKAGIPEYAEQILLELENPETRREIGDFLTAIVGDIADSSFATLDETPRTEIFQRYQCPDSTECKRVIGSRLAEIDKQSIYLAMALIICAALMLLAVYRTTDPANPLPWVLLSLSAMLLLACGVLTPMLEIEAQISHLKFMLMGHPVEFFNEVVYFQSKSILDVVSILMRTHEADMVMVGILLMTFSVVFPSLKLLASIVHIYNPRGLRPSPAVKFFVFKSAKWSMADVMVIAIFMAYIAFNGMIDNQWELVSRGAASAGVDVLTSNGTSLQLGFYMFLAFTIFSLLISTIMESAIRKGD